MSNIVSDYVYYITPMIGWLSAQFIKVAIDLRKDGITFSDIWSSGGMPSSHTSFVVSLATILILQLGLNDPITVVAVSFGAIVIYDSMGVRRTVGELSQLMSTSKEKYVHVSKGHSPKEVTFGILLGILIGFLCSLLV